MQKFSERVAVERASWLAELSNALEEARRLTKQLGASNANFDAIELYARIEAVRLEIEHMRLRKRPPIWAENDPEWSMLWSANRPAS